MIAAVRPAATAGERSIELADILNRYADAYLREHCLRSTQAKVVHAIRSCRTAALGGHCEWCARCGFRRYAYHSCRNRHCPKCQALAKAQWLELRRRQLLPTPYFHNVFTLPHELNPLILYSQQNQRLLLGLLFHAAAQTLVTFGRNNLGGQVGFTLVLHTWDQQLRGHFHVHALIAGGALSADGDRWISAGRQFLFPVRALSKVFRAEFLEAFAELCRTGQLQLPPQLQHLATEAGLQRWLRPLRRKSWIVYCKPPFAGPEKLLDYLGRYTHRVAISNHRLLSAEGGHVRFHWRDRADGDRRKIAVLPAGEFIQRFLQHLLPHGFMRIRHYGFLANRTKKQALARCREHLAAAEPELEPVLKTAAQWMLELTGIDITRCPHCGAQMLRTELRSRPQPPPSRAQRPRGAPSIRLRPGTTFDTS
jgi:hypothetical protein